VVRPLDVYVTRRPPTARRFLSQRVRQAYDDVAQPWRLALFLPLLPVALSGRRGRRAVGAALVGSMALAEAGRRRAGGAAHFPVTASLLAPAWVAERSVCSWLAVGQLPLGGVRYGGQRLRVAAHNVRQLRRRAAARRPLVPAGGPEPSAMGAVTERLEGGPAAPAEREGGPPGVDLAAVGGQEADVAANDERAVGVGADLRGGRLAGLSHVSTGHP
jgi:hypothetical protein